MIKPLRTQITILQQEGYSLSRFLGWWFRHPFTYFISTKKPLVVTKKITALLRLSYFIFGSLFLFSLVSKYFFLAPLSLLILVIQPFIYLFAATILLIPYEKINRRRTVLQTRKIIQSQKDLTVIGITGSFGKTSVKDFLYTILSAWQETIKTPESYNTIFGIAKVVDLELLTKTKIFICEMGAYIRGEVTELCHMVPPKFAILTAVGTQHLERFKNIFNTTLAKFELIDSVKPNCGLVNLDNPYIAKQLTLPQYQAVKTYSLINSKADFFVKQYNLSPHGVSFTLSHKGQEIFYDSILFGTSNLYNLTAAISMATMLQVPPEIISKQVKIIKPSSHRLELKKINKATLIDNAFSSNEEGFTTLISDLSKLPGKKVLITPGIIELGSRTIEVHKNLGQLASSVFDKFILVGKSLRTLSFEQGLKKKVTYIPNSTNLWPLIDELSHDYDWILLENDLPDNF